MSQQHASVSQRQDEMEGGCLIMRAGVCRWEVFECVFCVYAAHQKYAWCFVVFFLLLVLSCDSHHYITITILLCLFTQVRTMRRIYNFMASDSKAAQEWIDKLQSCLLSWMSSETCPVCPSSVRNIISVGTHQTSAVCSSFVHNINSTDTQQHLLCVHLDTHHTSTVSLSSGQTLASTDIQKAFSVSFIWTEDRLCRHKKHPRCVQTGSWLRACTGSWLTIWWAVFGVGIVIYSTNASVVERDCLSCAARDTGHQQWQYCFLRIIWGESLRKCEEEHSVETGRQAEEKFLSCFSIEDGCLVH